MPNSYRLLNRNSLLYFVTFVIFIFFTVWWVLINFTSLGNDSMNREIYSASYGILALYGGIIGLFISAKWGGYKSYMGRTIMFFSIGLLLQEFGQLVYSFYSLFLAVEVPYPSIGDVGFFGSIPLYILGALSLSKVSGVTFGLRSYRNKLSALFIPILVLATSYFIFLWNYEYTSSSLLTTFLDFGYPLGLAIYLSIGLVTYLLSREFLGGVMKNKVLLLLFALCVQYIADFVFLYRQNRGIFETAGISEYIYFIAYLLMTLTLILFNSTADKLRNGNVSKE